MFRQCLVILRQTFVRIGQLGAFKVLERDCPKSAARLSKSARPQLGDWGRWGASGVPGYGTQPSKLKNQSQ